MVAPFALAADVVEFYNANLDTYFITSDPAEAAAIDAGGAGPGWSRTGETFGSLGITPVCRFYGSQNPGPNSHFYTASATECAQLKQIQQSTPATQKRWNYESLDFFTSLPTAGQCPRNTVPIYRAYNNGFARGIDSNHRITSNPAAIQQVVARGWQNEGIVMCGSNANFANQVVQSSFAFKGIWTAVSFSGSWPEILRLDGSAYMLATTITSPAGFEYGTFAYDPNDGRFYTATTKDTNGAVGFSNRTVVDQNASLRIENDDLVARRADGTEAARYRKLTSQSSSVLGGWGTPAQFVSNSLYFFPNGAYLLVDVTGATGASAGCGPAGIEYGSYTWSATTQNLTLNPFIDSDGCGGFVSGGAVTLRAAVSADGGTLSISNTATPGTPIATFTRLTP